MIFNNLDLTKDEDFKIFSESVTEDFIAFKISKCKNTTIFDALLKYAELKEIDEDLLGDCIKENATLKGLLQQEMENNIEFDNNEW